MRRKGSRISIVTYEQPLLLLGSGMIFQQQEKNTFIALFRHCSETSLLLQERIGATTLLAPLTFFGLSICLRVMIYMDGPLTQFSILLIGARALLDNQLIGFGYIARLLQWGGEGYSIGKIISACFYGAQRKGGRVSTLWFCISRILFYFIEHM